MSANSFDDSDEPVIYEAAKITRLRVNCNRGFIKYLQRNKKQKEKPLRKGEKKK